MVTRGISSIEAKAKREKGEIHWGDETELRSDDVNGCSYAPTGPPIQRVECNPEKLKYDQDSNQPKTNGLHVWTTFSAGLFSVTVATRS